MTPGTNRVNQILKPKRYKLSNKRRRGGAHYDAEGNLLTVRKPSKDPAEQLRVSVPGSMARALEKHCQKYGLKKSKVLQAWINEKLGK